MKIAGIQFSCSEEKEKNTEKALRLLSVAVERGAKIVCFQELFNLFWFPREKDESFFELADSKESELFKAFFESARRNEVVILLPFFERDGNRFFNSCMVIDADGEIKGIYRKIHLARVPFYEEEFYFQRGKEIPVFETRYGRIGIQISWDNLFPEVSRILALKGAEIVFSPTSCSFNTYNLWQTVISANAIVNGLFIMRVNRVGREKLQDFYGMSFCVNPEGEIISGPTGLGEGILISEIDLDSQREFRRRWPILDSRVPGLYRELIGELT